MNEPANSKLEEAIATATALLGPGEWSARELEADAVYVWEDTRGGRAIILDTDGSALFASSAVSPADHQAAFASDRRTPAEAFDTKGQEAGPASVSRFTMKIAEVFEFESGQTVFAGSITDGGDYINPCRCVIEVEGTVVAQLSIEGEMIPKGDTNSAIRSVSTRDDTVLSREDLIGAVLRSGCSLCSTTTSPKTT